VERTSVWKRPLPVAILIGLLAETLFLIRLGVPSIPVFDETHYLPAARALLALDHPANTEHPMLGKMLIAVGMKLFGDTPFGWRFFSTLAGTAVVVSGFAILQIAYGRLRTSLTGAALLLLGCTVYVQARIAMLDGFMAAFVMTGVALYLRALRHGGWGAWLGAAACFGLAVGCKWVALPYAGLAGAVFLWLKWEDRRRFPGIGWLAGAAAFGLAATAAYFVTFAPAFFYASEPLTLARLLPFQAEMYRQQTQILPPHTYQSAWWTWPLDKRPIWYLYEPADGAQRGILMIGNPLVMWTGLIAVIACGWAWVQSGDRRPLGLALFWAFSLAIWALIPKSLGFYYYYYLSSIILCLVIAAAIDHWRARLNGWDEAYLAACAVVFLWFFPILSAQALAAPDAFRKWTWFDSWV
jgi:dolichyl-phosphate-mannose-protein mannosyltransferase